MSIFDDVEKALVATRRAGAMFDAACDRFSDEVKRGDFRAADKARYEALDSLDAMFDGIAASYMRTNGVAR